MLQVGEPRSKSWSGEKRERMSTVTLPLSWKEGMPSIPAVYMLRNLVTDDVYIGSTVSLRNRIYDHRRRLVGHRSSSTNLQKAWDRIGSESFFVEVIECPERGELAEHEQFWIDTLQPSLNSLRVAVVNLGHAVSDGQRVKARENRLRQADPRLGKKHSPETRGLLRSLMLGVKRGPYNRGCKCGECSTCIERPMYQRSYLSRRDEILERTRKGTKTRAEMVASLCQCSTCAKCRGRAKTAKYRKNLKSVRMGES